MRSESQPVPEHLQPGRLHVVRKTWTRGDLKYTSLALQYGADLSSDTLGVRGDVNVVRLVGEVDPGQIGDDGWPSQLVTYSTPTFDPHYDQAVAQGQSTLTLPDPTSQKEITITYEPVTEELLVQILSRTLATLRGQSADTLQSAVASREYAQRAMNEQALLELDAILTTGVLQGKAYVQLLSPRDRALLLKVVTELLSKAGNS